MSGVVVSMSSCKLDTRGTNKTEFSVTATWVKLLPYDGSLTY